MNRLRSLDPPPPMVRFEHKHPGDCIHFDIKRLACFVEQSHRVHQDRTRRSLGAGYEFLHIAIDDHSRIAFAAILPDETSASAQRFFHMTCAHLSRFGFGIRRVLTDNGLCYRHAHFQSLLSRHHIRQHFTRLYRPQTNDKDVRFIQTALRAWAYARTYRHSAERDTELDFWIHDYNFHRTMLASTSTRQPADQASAGKTS